MNNKENIRNLQHFAEVEFMIDQYFDRNLQKLVDKGYQELRDNQSTELAQAYEKKSSPFMADPRIAMQQAMYEVKTSGKWNTKHTEDLVLDVNKKFYGDKNTAEDLVLLKENWKYCAISRLGQARYDELSKKPLSVSSVRQAYRKALSLVPTSYWSRRKKPYFQIRPAGRLAVSAL